MKQLPSCRKTRGKLGFDAQQHRVLPFQLEMSDGLGTRQMIHQTWLDSDEGLIV